MNLFKRTKKITDERVENVRNKIYKEMYYVILAICLVSALFKLYKYAKIIHNKKNVQKVKKKNKMNKIKYFLTNKIFLNK